MFDDFPEDGDRFRPSYGLSRTVEANIIINSFGDGYEQRIPMGKNYTRDTISVTWNNMPWNYSADKSKDLDGNIIYNFLYERLKITPFYFRETENDKKQLYICEELSYNYSQFNLATINAQFKQYRGWQYNG